MGAKWWCPCGVELSVSPYVLFELVYPTGSTQLTCPGCHVPLAQLELEVSA